MQSDLYILQREAEFLANGETSFRKLIDDLQQQKEPEQSATVSTGKKTSTTTSSSSGSSFSSKEDQDIDDEFKVLYGRLAIAKQTKKEAQTRRKQLASDAYDRSLLVGSLVGRANELASEHAALLDVAQAVHIEHSRVCSQLRKLMQCNVINDAFHVWYAGPFATINGFRLGSLPFRPIEWTEINAALGQAVLAVATVATRAKYEFKKYDLMPLGSFPKVFKVGDRRTVFTLFTDGSFSLFPKRKFNYALIGFLHCVEELGSHVNKHDPTMSIPYAIDAAEGKVSNQLVTLGVDDELWTRSLKFLLADIKWIVAWAAKHCNR